MPLTHLRKRLDCMCMCYLFRLTGSDSGFVDFEIHITVKIGGQLNLTLLERWPH